MIYLTTSKYTPRWITCRRRSRPPTSISEMKHSQKVIELNTHRRFVNESDSNYVIFIRSEVLKKRPLPVEYHQKGPKTPLCQFIRQTCSPTKAPGSESLSRSKNVAHLLFGIDSAATARWHSLSIRHSSYFKFPCIPPLAATKKRCSFGSCWASSSWWWGPNGGAPRTAAPQWRWARAWRNTPRPPCRSPGFFQMFLFITFASAECTGRVPRAVRAECTTNCAARPPRPSTNHHTLTHRHTHKQSESPTVPTDGPRRAVTRREVCRLVSCLWLTMDSSAMDSASDHSSHASSGSPAVAVKPPPSPPSNANNNNNNTQQQGGHGHSGSPRQASPLGPPMSMAQHPLSPPPVSSAGLVRTMGLGHLPPHGLGLLNSLGVLHNPLDLMAHHAPPRSYNSPPPISTSDPTANECKLVDYRGQKVAAFIIAGDTMLCLPQAFELFLKHLVGGLHTVYTKLKRLDIVPLVCNVEQVRILRGLGAIQPGVNRCKLLSCKDFDTLYKDCTTARYVSAALGVVLTNLMSFTPTECVGYESRKSTTIV